MIDFIPDSTLYPFESKWFRSSDGDIHYIDEGDGQTVLFLHGAMTWSFVYRKVIRQLSGSFRCVAPDYLGFGLSDRPLGFDYRIESHIRTVKELLNHLNLEEVVLVGHDWGGPIGLSAFLDEPERAAGLVLSNTTAWPVTGIAARGFSATMKSRFMQRQIIDRNFLIERVLLRSLGPALSGLEREHYRAVQAEPEDRIGLAVMPREITDARETLSKLETLARDRFCNASVLLPWGMEDRVYPARSHLTKFESWFANSTSIRIEGAGLFLSEERPAPMARLIAEQFGRPR